MNLKLVFSYFLIFKSHKFNDTSSGSDERPLSYIETQSIYEFNYKQKIIELLKSKYINISDKLDKINEINENKTEIQSQSNILNGGFLDDW